MTEDTTQQLPLTEPGLLDSLEETARELASAAGAEITAALGRSVSVDYKAEQKSEDTAPTDPVSEVDRAVEAMIRERLAERFPEHAILGEERDDHPAPTAEYLWAVDPVDGTTNFVNRFPLFAASIGVLRDGAPIAGAIWCSTSHALRAGVYHAHSGSPLRFEGEPLAGVAANEGGPPQSEQCARRRAWAHCPMGQPRDRFCCDRVRFRCRRDVHELLSSGASTPGTWRPASFSTRLLGERPSSGRAMSGSRSSASRRPRRSREDRTPSLRRLVAAGPCWHPRRRPAAT